MADDRLVPLIEYEADPSAPILRYDSPSPLHMKEETTFNWIFPVNFFTDKAREVLDLTNAEERKSLVDRIIASNRANILEFLSDPNTSMRDVYALFLDSSVTGAILQPFRTCIFETGDHNNAT